MTMLRLSLKGQYNDNVAFITLNKLQYKRYTFKTGLKETLFDLTCE